ncbi:UNVERIFIED_CONTAM: hypothetical protein Slati_3609200 [Sesamum latifolium]|uniref:Uncharacterized protein n=1 Tax=Sesamum latifolium TaxID=2727402 RepID=A0AAW2TYZ2_9LAMI
MADDFGAENLEDGELWLPSDFFSMDEVQVSNKLTTPYHHCSSSNLSCMQDSHRFSSSTFLHPQTHIPCLSKPLPSLQRFKPAVRYGVSGGAGGGTHDPCGCGTGNSWAGWSSIYQLQRLNPVQTQVGNFFEERAWALQRQQQHNHRFGQNRVFPGVRMGAHGGTGVFLPRISSDMLAATVTKNHNHHCFGKGQRLMKSHELQLPPRKILLNRRQEECRGYFAAERERKLSHHMGFPSGPPPDDPKQKVVMGYPSIDRHHQAQQMYPEAPRPTLAPATLRLNLRPNLRKCTLWLIHRLRSKLTLSTPMHRLRSNALQSTTHPNSNKTLSTRFPQDMSHPNSNMTRGHDPSQFQNNTRYPVSSGYDPSQFQHNAQHPIPSAYGPPQFQHDPKYPIPSGYDPSRFHRIHIPSHTMTTITSSHTSLCLKTKTVPRLAK